MNWDAIGAVAELFGSLGALMTVIYIAFQVRDSKEMNILEKSNAMTNNIAGSLDKEILKAFAFSPQARL